MNYRNDKQIPFFFEEEWEKACATLKNCGADLSKIRLVPNVGVVPRRTGYDKEIVIPKSYEYKPRREILYNGW